MEMAEGAAKQIISNGKCKVVVVSLGDKGAMLITQGNTHHIMPPPAMINSTVGAGDSLVAGIVLSLEKNWRLLEAVQYSRYNEPGHPIMFQIRSRPVVPNN